MLLMMFDECEAVDIVVRWEWTLYATPVQVTLDCMYLLYVPLSSRPTMLATGLKPLVSLQAAPVPLTHVLVRLTLDSYFSEIRISAQDPNHPFISNSQST